ncbi:hypothetical protein BDN72DRAFT_575366 [Pluteus cervinus]|uniref:Uncharacterized protein n=1 Tax=Pluteus cervinus TaxID=181527 RepID=A0ACD3AW18_9AGAR|nr:hypothetical protein BDN72DRAFT_575366 [Pluteus cervinus]
MFWRYTRQVAGIRARFPKQKKGFLVPSLIFTLSISERPYILDSSRQHRLDININSEIARILRSSKSGRSQTLPRGVFITQDDCVFTGME